LAGCDIGERRRGTLRVAGVGEKDEFACGLLESEAEFMTNAAIYAFEAGNCVGHFVADEIVVAAHAFQGVRVFGIDACAIPAMIAISERRPGEAGSFMP